VNAVRLHHTENRGWLLAGGILSVGLGGLIAAQLPESALWVIGLFVASISFSRGRRSWQWRARHGGCCRIRADAECSRAGEILALRHGSGLLK